MSLKLYTVYLLVILTSSLPCPEDLKCRACTDDKKCKICYKSVLNADGLCEIPSTTVDNCTMYQSKTQCSECDYGFFLDKGECVKIPIEGCAVTDNVVNNICLGCFDGIPSSKDGCNENDKCKVENCDICGINDTETCIRCESGFSLDKENNCIEEPYRNCQKVEDFNSSACALCLNGFYDNETLCVKKAFSLSVLWGIMILAKAFD